MMKFPEKERVRNSIETYITKAPMIINNVNLGLDAFICLIKKNNLIYIYKPGHAGSTYLLFLLWKLNKINSTDMIIPTNMMNSERLIADSSI